MSASKVGRALLAGRESSAKLIPTPRARPGEAEWPTPQAGDEAELLSKLNTSMKCLAAIFPDIQPEVFREMLGTFPEESRLHVVTEALLKHKAKWVKGRWRVADAATDRASVEMPGDPRPTIDKAAFRSTHYKDTVKSVLYEEFKGLSHSTIKAVLAENNHSYLDTRASLVKLAARSWRYSFTSLWTRRKALDPQQSPLVSLSKSNSNGPRLALIATPCDELNDEVERYLIAPLHAQAAEAQAVADRDLATRINEEQAEAESATYDCECCYSAVSFESIAACSTGIHFMCFTCIHRTASEAVYGQGWARSVDGRRSTLKCIAASPREECDGYIPHAAVSGAIEASEHHGQLWAKFEERAAREALDHCGLLVSRCPYCAYAEAREAHVKALPPSDFFSGRPTLLLIALVTLSFAALTPLVGLFIPGVALFIFSRRKRTQPPDPELRLEPNHGQKFICRRSSCLRITCLRCSAPWIDMHVCHQSSRQALQAHIESAVTDSIKRTCPKCNLSFVKSSGCNKLVCICGYSMCYICRQDVGKEGYAHFCPHFRANPGETCRECTRCDLYKTEDDDEVIRKAKAKAVEDWKAQAQGKVDAEALLAGLDEVGTSDRPHSRARGDRMWFLG